MLSYGLSAVVLKGVWLKLLCSTNCRETCIATVLWRFAQDALALALAQEAITLNWMQRFATHTT